MKVICTNHKNFTNLPCNPAIPRPAIGEEVTVIEETCYYGIDCYIFEEYKPLVGDYVYDKRNFSALGSDLDETTLVNEEWEEKYCVPVNNKLCV